MKRAAPLLALFIAVGVIVGAWILGTPPSAGPDEPSHVVRGAALVRGELDGERIRPLLEGFELPAHIGFPDPVCFAFQPETPATCATSLEAPTGDALLPTRSIDYPVWGHLAAGVGSYLPADWSSIGARVADALLPLLLLAGSLFAASRHGWAAAGGVLVALTVPVWFIVAVVNPSGLLIAGGIALWTAAANGSRGRARFGWQASRLDLVLIAAGWSALVLPRRDGLIYAVLIAGLAILIFDVGVEHLRRRIPVWVWAVTGMSTLATLAWAARSSSPTSSLLFAAPLVPVAAIGGRWVWRRSVVRWGRPGGAVVAALGIVATVAGSVLAMSLRGSGFSSDVLQRTIGQTGIDLRETIGIIGWLDTAVPETMVFLWLIGLGLLVAGAVISVSHRALIGATSILGVGVWASWVLTMVQDDASGTYWQGRYYLPLLVGVPIVLSTARIDRAVATRLAKAAGAISLVVVNVGFAAAMRRWGVGQSGSLMPWRWDTYSTVVSPLALLGLHIVGSSLLWRSVGNVATPADAAEFSASSNQLALSPAARRPPGVNLLGYHGAASGLGVAVRRLRASLEAAGVPVSVFEVEQSNSPRLGDDAESGVGPVRSATLAVVTAPELPGALAARPSLAEVDRVIGYWFWELGDVPATHRTAVDLVDEVWAPTAFIADAYRRVAGAPPVVVQPMHLAQPTRDQERVAAARRRLAPNDEFVFLVSLDLFSVVERKNPFGAIDAFARVEAAAGPAPRLVIKILNGEQRPAALQRIVDHVAESGVANRITIVDEFIDDDDMAALIASADCLVSLHRGEGLGLPLADAMWLGTPVIATRWSGNLDFMDDSNSCLIDAELVAVADGEGAYPDGMRWAEPDVEQAAEAMRRLSSDPSFARALARRGSGSMALLPDTSRCGAAYASTLANPIGQPVAPVPDFNAVLHELRTRALAGMPPGARRMLSVGCAGSWYFDWIAEAYGPVEEHVGIEYFSPQPDDLPEYVTWIADTAANMTSIADHSADLLFSGQNIEHLWPTDVVGFLAESNRVLSDGGTIVVDSPNRIVTERLGWSQPEHTIEFTSEEISDLLALAGFRVTRSAGLWDCAGFDELEPGSTSETRVRAKVIGTARIDDAFVWWFEARRVGPVDRPALQARIEQIFRVAWPERMSRRVVNQRASVGDDASVPSLALPSGEAGVIVHGPHAPLSAGSYTASFDVEVDGESGDVVGACLVYAGADRLGVVELIASGAPDRRRVVIPIDLDKMTFAIHGRIDATGIGTLTACPVLEFLPGRPIGH